MLIVIISGVFFAKNGRLEISTRCGVSSNIDVECDGIVGRMKVSPFRPNVREYVLEDIGDVKRPALPHIMLDYERVSVV